VLGRLLLRYGRVATAARFLTPFDQRGDGPADDRPGRSQAPAGQDIGRPVHAEIKAAETDEKRQQDGRGHDVYLQPGALLRAGEKHTQGQERHCGKKGVAAWKAEGLHLRDIGDEIRAGPLHQHFYGVADNRAARDRNEKEDRRVPVPLHGEKAERGDRDKGKDRRASEACDIARRHLKPQWPKRLGRLARYAHRHEDGTVETAEISLHRFARDFPRDENQRSRGEEQKKRGDFKIPGAVKAKSVGGHTRPIRKS